MASTDYRWLIEAKGCLVINEDIHSIVYHASQNVIIVTLFGEQIKVIDATSGIMIKSSDLSSNFGESHSVFSKLLQKGYKKPSFIIYYLSVQACGFNFIHTI